ncbi:hypothetical protein [Thioclava dalianensis]|uniref:hypothetical protein n=1 Tax=Thioclava dalianensis TaxID=1185766 RepID=UPI001FE14F6E|nr:hypothetical protein [Thioclava dalianensis]
MTHLYGTGSDAEGNAIESHVSRLRKRLKPYGIKIKTARGCLRSQRDDDAAQGHLSADAAVSRHPPAALIGLGPAWMVALHGGAAHLRRAL